MFFVSPFAQALRLEPALGTAALLVKDLPLRVPPLTSPRRCAEVQVRKQGASSQNKMNRAMQKKRIQTAFLGVPECEVVAQFTYRPRISSEHLLKLWLLKRRRRKPITQLVAEALDVYFDTMEKGGERNELSKTHNSR